MKKYNVTYTLTENLKLHRTLSAENQDEIKGIVFGSTEVEYEANSMYYRFSLDDCILVTIQEIKETDEWGVEIL
ncbi:hypothetical protein [Peribacillus sp. R9-11]|uniref:hypothetical protein n=1 Tax=Peribacillus sp. R9-11 TaxID=3073271 RepID=UPI002868AD31|nr:hypothetical protein [Peribacillus sp. R9-11]WMX57439.1 hypothetical protein RE409_09560 [Peribacillus sp. R9-11]